MVQTARERGVEVRELAFEMSSLFKAMCDDLNISYDRFIRTTDEDHYRASQAIWQAMREAGDLYLDRYEGWYSVRDEAFYDEKELVEGEGGERLSPQGTPVQWTAEETWFFRLSKYQQPLLDLYRDNPDFIRPEARRNEIMRFVEGGLSDLSVSRTSFDWGVPVPDSPGHVMYVWVDALRHALLASRSASDRQGYYAFPYSLLARVPHVGRHRATQIRVRAWLPPPSRGEDVEEPRQRRKSAGIDRGIRCRRLALLPVA